MSRQSARSTPVPLRSKPEARSGRGFEPFRLLWALFCNVKFALVLVGAAVVAGLVGTVLPQVPAPMRQNAAARSAWLELRRGDFGLLTGPMDRVELFDVFHSAWFNGLWFVIIVAVTVCAVSRFMPTWRSVQRPQKSVGAAYFERAHHRASFHHEGGAEGVKALLGRRRYRVEDVTTGNGPTLLFAERYSWSQYGTFLSHLALLMLLIGGLLTFFIGFDKTLVIAEATPAAPVFGVPGAGQIFIKMADAYREIDGGGNIVDYHSIIEVRRGAVVKVCKTTVNDPCRAFGYKVHQAAFFDDLARLRITGPGGAILFDNVLDFESRTTTVPRMVVRARDGQLLFEGDVPQMATDTGISPSRDDDVALGFLPLRNSSPGVPGGVLNYTVAWRLVAQRLRVVLSGPDLGESVLEEGSTTITQGGVSFEFTGSSSVPAMRVNDMPGATPGETVVVQMPRRGDGSAYLFISGIEQGEPGGSLALSEGEPGRNAAGYSYVFAGRVEASGVSVKRDPGDTFIWLAVGMAVVGLAITFYVPRRRLWVRIDGTRTSFAGVAERTTRFGRELRFMGAELGANDVLLPGDLTDD